MRGNGGEGGETKGEERAKRRGRGGRQRNHFFGSGLEQDFI